MTASSPPAAGPGAVRGGSSTSGKRLRQALAIDERGAFITYAQTRAGRMLLLLAAMAAVMPHFGIWTGALAAAAAMGAVAWPARRTAILFAATWLSACLNTLLGEVDTLANIRAVLAQEGMAASLGPVLAMTFLFALFIASFAVLRHVRQAPQSLFARRPLLLMLVAEALLCTAGGVGLLHGWPRVLVWSAVFAFTPYLWFLPFAIADLRSRTPSPLTLQMAVLRPYWSPAYLPFGKGAAFLRKHLSTTPQELAVTQLKAIKLLVWANLLFVLLALLGWLFDERIAVPDVEDAINAFLAGQPYPRARAWAAIVLAAARYALQVAAWAHLFIGIARLAGYRLPRGSWRPLEARTLMDYFNRFHYYFKELLVDLFFMPTFFRVFKNHPRLRMFFATFMAAGVGNALWHFTRNIDVVASAGLPAALASYTSYLFYAALLAVGVGLSQVRANMGLRPAATPLARVTSFLFVWSFVIGIHVFGDGSRIHTLTERLQFMAALFGASQ
jgi:hypothetical protein